MAIDPELWMWERARRLLDEVDRLQDRLLDRGSGRPSRRCWRPAVDVFEIPDGLIVLAALPGVDPAQVQVGVQAGRVVIRGSRRLPMGLRGAHVHRLEIPHGEFERVVPLPSGSFEIEAPRFCDGCLMLVLKRGGDQ